MHEHRTQNEKGKGRWRWYTFFFLKMGINHYDDNGMGAPHIPSILPLRIPTSPLLYNHFSSSSYALMPSLQFFHSLSVLCMLLKRAQKICCPFMTTREGEDVKLYFL